jgi:hypothetical protein
VHQHRYKGRNYQCRHDKKYYETAPARFLNFSSHLVQALNFRAIIAAIDDAWVADGVFSIFAR